MKKQITKMIKYRGARKALGKGLPWLAIGGLAVAGGAYYFFNSTEGARRRRFVMDQGKKLWKGFQDFTGIGAEESQEAGAEFNKPYPVERTSKHHPRSRVRGVASEPILNLK